MKRNIAKLCAYLACAQLLTACGSTNISASPTLHKPQMAKPMTSNSSSALSSMTWRLHSIQDSNGVISTTMKSGDAASHYQVIIKDRLISITGGCNNMSGSINFGQGNTFSIGPMAETKRACLGTLMQADSEISDYLKRATSYSLTNQTLTLNTNNNQTLRFNGIATDETKYGSKGIRKFIELTNTSKGIQWREAKYDANWIQNNKGAPWERAKFPGIQGFTPKMNMHYIVRLHEYADPRTKKTIWVKDRITRTGMLK